VSIVEGRVEYLHTAPELCFSCNTLGTALEDPEWAASRMQQRTSGKSGYKLMVPPPFDFKG
jgi:hypothetical protein